MDSKAEIINNIKKLSDYGLKLQLSEGKDAYRNGIYDLLLEEAKNREIEINQDTIMNALIENNDKQELNIVKLGYAWAFIFGILGLILGIYIIIKKEKNNKKEYKFNDIVRNHGRNIIIISLIMLTFGWTLIIFFLNSFINLF